MLKSVKICPSLLQMSQDQDPENEGQVLTRYRPKVQQPSMYQVLLLNDDFTPMDFVIHILKKFFLKTDTEATQIMLSVHHRGSGLAGTYSKEVAETKVYQVNEYSRSQKHPLKCIMEKVL